MPVTCPAGTFPYTIQEGDTLWNLSQTYGVSIESIVGLNPGIDPMNLQIGLTVCIPAVPMPITSQSKFAYSIGKCDTIRGIARKFYVSVDSILQINPGLDLRCLVVGTIIFVPINCCGPNTFRYAVRRGDTLNSIANRFNCCPMDIIDANPNIDFDCLVRCQVICIPSA
jgi:Predicted glycosyl hydrolase